ncbi:MAG: SLC45 family MFS transporter [Ruminococcaceae bacterium]|nr:SLC45 family MFS transporter [Oscillospiraceae bacterium]
MKLNYKRTILIGLAFMGILAFWQFYDQVIPYLLENTFGLSTFTANAIMSVDNILAIFMLPLFGAISDRTHTRLGKRTPYILFGTIAAVILMIVVGIFTEQRSFLGFVIALMALLVVMAVYRTPAVAYMPDVTEKPLRSKANAIINLVGYIGGIFATIVMMFMLKSDKNAAGETVYSENQKFLPVFIVIAAFMLLSVLVMVFTTNENKLLAETNIKDDEEVAVKGGKMDRPVFMSLVLILASVFLWFMAYNAVTTAFSRYCVNVWKVDLSVSSSFLLTATIAAIAAFVPLGFISGKLGRKKTVLLGIALMTVCYAIAIFIRQQTPFMYLIFGLVGVGWAAINVNSFPMVVEMSTGSDVGKYTGFYYTFSMAAQITTPLLSGLLIDKLGFGYSVLFPYAVLFSALSFVTMSLVRHGDCKPASKKSVLENFDVED